MQKFIHLRNINFAYDNGSKIFEVFNLQIATMHKIIYYGDKIWDYNATKTLGIDFIGIGKNENMRKVASRCYDDFSYILWIPS